MKKIMIIVMLMITAMLVAETYYVDDDNTQGPWLGTEDFPFQYIHEGISEAIAGDEIIVRDGIYDNENTLNIFLDQYIVLRSESNNPNSCVIEQNNDNSPFILINNHNIAGSVLIKGFSIIYSGDNPPQNCFEITTVNLTLENCLIKDYQNGIFVSGGSIGDIAIDNVTITSNIDYGIISHDIRNVFISNSIIYGNGETPDVNLGVNSSITYSDIQGEWAGEGNIDEDPLFVNPAEDDFSLKWNSDERSPCIDTGDPESEYDEDNTPADMGAIQAMEHKHDFVELPLDQLDNGWKWLSFPVLDVVWEEGAIAGNVLFDIMQEPIPAELDIVQAETYTIFYDQQWWNAGEQFLRTEGFKFHMNEEAVLGVPGFKVADDTAVELLGESYGNWVGYWLEETQSVEDAFGYHWDEHNIKSIEAQHWSAAWWEAGNQWLIKVKKGFKPTLSYGEMVIIQCDDPIVEFRWNNETEEDERVVFAEPENFEFEEQADYIPIFIEINSTYPPKEIGAIVDDVCVGATVVEDTLTQINAYVNGIDPGEIELELYYSERAEPRRLSSYNCVAIDKSEKIENSISTENMKPAYLITLKEDSDLIPDVFDFTAMNYPNPFNPSTTIAYSIPNDDLVNLTIYNIKGQKVKTLVNGNQQAGSYSIVWNGNDENGRKVSSGIYLYKLSTNEKTLIKKMILIK